MLGDNWVSAAEPFVLKFGGLTFLQSLFVHPDEVVVSVLRLKTRVEQIVRQPCCPIARSTYMGDECILWIDAKERYFAIDSLGLVYLGDNSNEVLDLLLVSKRHPPLPPAEIREEVLKAINWDNDEAGCDVEEWIRSFQ